VIGLPMPSAGQTKRQEIIDLLSEREMTARELSQTLGIREKEVYEHLPHIARSLSARGKNIVIGPPRCLACGYVFQNRRRFTRPGRCPQCKKAHLQAPTYHILGQ
jgi:predicted Zn-ribbon and HTH transcriptional regulator